MDGLINLMLCYAFVVTAIGSDSSGSSGGAVGGGSANGQCIDIHQHSVSQGLHYVPGPNSCTVCVCDKGSAKWCKSVLCSPPQDCRSFRMGNSCCEFKCLDDILGPNGVSSGGATGSATGNGAKTNVYGGSTPADTYDIALRLIASLVTAVLSLSLLFFLIHRLRRKKGAVVHRGGGGIPLHGHQMPDDHGHHHHMHHHVPAAAAAYNGIGYITAGGMGGYMTGGPNSAQQHPPQPGSVPNAHDCGEYPYNDAGYPLWKPAGGGVGYFPRGEAPPPYEEAVRAARADAAAVAAAAAAAALYDHHARQQTTTTTTANAAPPVPVAESVSNPVSLTLVHNTHVNITQHQHNQQQQTQQQQQQQNYGNSSNIGSGRSGNDDSHQNDSQRQPLLPQNAHPQLRLVCRQSKSMLVNQVDVHSEAGVPIVVVPANVPTNSVSSNRKRNTSSTTARSRIAQMHPVAITTEVTTSTSTFMSTSSTPAVTVRREPRAHRTIPASVQSTTIVPELMNIATGIPVSTASRYASSYRSRQSHRPSGQTGAPPHSTRSQPSVAIIRRPADDSDLEDYRSECENCKSLSLENCSDELLNETMTLQRHPAESSSEQQPAYYRTSLTLPAHSKKLRTLNSAHRDAWFTPMQELSSSSDEE